jgi:soluble lytic murein transglycosylase-like protein
VQILPKSRVALGIACLLAAQLCTTAHAFQRITLRNGFSYDCTNSEPIDNTHVRLFLLSSTPQPSDRPPDFIDLRNQDIASNETLPDPPPPAPAALPAAAAPTEDIHELLAKAGAQHNIDIELLASVIKAESGGRANAVSRTGARGLMQLMPGTAQQLGVNDAFRPDQNIAGGAAYLDQLLTRYKDYKDGLALALAAYNAGPAAVDHYHGIPPYRETINYVARVLNEFIRRKSALEHAATPSASPAQPPAQTIASVGVY